MENEYVAGNRAAFDRLQHLVDRLNDDELRRPMSDGWTVSAVLAHLAFWDRRFSRLVERWQRDDFSPSPYDHDAINDAMKPGWLLIPPAAAAAEAIAAAIEADAIAATVDEALAGCIRQGGTASLNRAHHRTTHLNEIEPMFP